ncbi:MAG: hypothetical protein V3T04_01910 [Dehalococcoidia bacterium]
MNKGGFRSFLKKQRRSEGTINQCVLFTSNFEDNLTEHRHSKGIDSDMRNLKRENLEEIIGALNDLEVDVVSGKEVVNVFVEQ